MTLANHLYHTVYPSMPCRLCLDPRTGHPVPKEYVRSSCYLFTIEPDLDAADTSLNNVRVNSTAAIDLEQETQDSCGRA